MFLPKNEEPRQYGTAGAPRFYFLLRRKLLTLSQYHLGRAQLYEQPLGHAHVLDAIDGEL